MDDLLPELIWIGLVETNLGKKRSGELCVELAKTATTCSSDAQGAFAFISEYGNLSNREKESLVNRLGRTGALADIHESLQILDVHYPESPLAFLFPTYEQPKQSQGGLHELKMLISELEDRRGLVATNLQATAIYIYFLNDKLKVPRASAMADFPEIESYPDTEASRRVASSVRALINGFSGALDPSNEWRNYFWNRGRNLEPCERIPTDGE